MLLGIPCLRVGYYTRRHCAALGELYKLDDAVYSVIPAAAQVANATTCLRWYSQYD